MMEMRFCVLKFRGEDEDLHTECAEEEHEVHRRAGGLYGVRREGEGKEK